MLSFSINFEKIFSDKTINLRYYKRNIYLLFELDIFPEVSFLKK